MKENSHNKMSEYGAMLQTNIMELVKYIENFRNQTAQLEDLIQKGEAEQAKVSDEINLLQVKLNMKTEKLNSMRDRRDDINQKLEETETHLKQLLDTSDVILNVIKRESSSKH